MVQANQWCSLNMTDVELPSGTHLDHWVLRQPPVVVTAMVNHAGEVLLLWRHRFITNTWGYELPGGVLDPGESILDGAAREAEEETGWRPRTLKPLMQLQSANGLSDCIHHVYVSADAVHIGAPEDSDESDRLEWIALERIPELVGNGSITASTTAAALMQLHVSWANNYR